MMVAMGNDDALKAWLTDATGDPGPFELRPLSGGNSNETLALSSPQNQWVVRRPPAASLAPSAHAMDREHLILTALADQPVPSPKPVALCTDPEIPQTPALVMEQIDGVALTDTLPDTYPRGAEAAQQIGEAVVDALAQLHSVPWQDVGLQDFGRPDGFLERQVPRWRKQLDRYMVRELPHLDAVTNWLDVNRPQTFTPGILHGDFHFDNCLLTPQPPIAVAAIVDWEMATIGDPLLDLGLFLGFWGTDRPERPAMPQVQAVSRVEGTPSREELANRYAEKSGRSVEHLDWYIAFALWKLAMIVEGAYAQYLDGRLRTPYAARLEHDVPALLAEAAHAAGLTPGAVEEE
jgi:aminoglycoside phosphotransferase (APT) family kinase protein